VENCRARGLEWFGPWLDRGFDATSGWLIRTGSAAQYELSDGPESAVCAGLSVDQLPPDFMRPRLQ